MYVGYSRVNVYLDRKLKLQIKKVDGMMKLKS